MIKSLGGGYFLGDIFIKFSTAFYPFSDIKMVHLKFKTIFDLLRNIIWGPLIFSTAFNPFSDIERGHLKFKTIFDLFRNIIRGHLKFSTASYSFSDINRDHLKYRTTSYLLLNIIWGNLKLWRFFVVFGGALNLFPYPWFASIPASAKVLPKKYVHKGVNSAKKIHPDKIQEP